MSVTEGIAAGNHAGVAGEEVVEPSAIAVNLIEVRL